MPLIMTVLVAFLTSFFHGGGGWDGGGGGGLHTNVPT